MQQMRNIPAVANIDLFPRIIDGGVGIRRVFKFYHTERKPIDKQKHIWSAGLLLTVIDIFYSKLVDTAKNVFLGFSKFIRDTIRGVPLRGVK